MSKRKHEGYMDHVYNTDKFIGSTNKGTPNQTSYFRNNNTQEHGRITTDHKNADNVGRNKVQSTKKYTAQNQTVNRNGMPTERYVEETTMKSGKKVKHTSRSKFSPPSPNSSRQAYEDLQRFTEEKPKTSAAPSRKKHKKKGPGM